jgi:hypothetical protein
MNEVLASKIADEPFFEQGRRQRDKLKNNHDIISAFQQRGQEGAIVVNLVHSHIRSLLPTIFFREPTITARPMNPLKQGREETWELVLNNTLKRNGFKVQTKQTTLDALTYHEGWKKVTRIVSEEDTEDDDTEPVEATQMPRGPAPWGGKEMPVSVRVSPLNVIVDYLAPGRDPDHARFIAIEYRRPYSELKADGSPYDKEALAQVKKTKSGEHKRQYGSPTMQRRVDETSDKPSADGVDMITFYEVYVYQDVDRKLWKQTVWLAEGADKPLRMETWDDLVGEGFPGWPVHRLIFNPVPDDFPVSEVETWDGLQEAVNWAASKLLSFVSHQNQIVAINPSSLVDPGSARDRILKGAPVEVIEVQDGARASDAVASVQGSGVPQDAYRIIDVLLEFVERVSQLGQNQQQQGGVFRTATEAAAVSQASQVRSNERVDVMSDFLREDVRKMVAVIRQFADRDFAFKTAGDTGAVRWEQFSIDDIRWEPDINIDVDSFRDMDMQQELSKWLMVFNSGMQLFQLMGPVIRIDLIYQELVKAARIAGHEKLVGNLTGQREYQLLEIMQIILGTYVPAQPTDPHGEHIASIDRWLNSPLVTGQGTTGPQIPPEIVEQVIRHRDEHVQFAQANTEGADSGQPQTLGDNSLDVLGTAQTQRQSSAVRREATRTGGREQQEFI